MCERLTTRLQKALVLAWKWLDCWSSSDSAVSAFRDTELRLQLRERQLRDLRLQPDLRVVD